MVALMLLMEKSAELNARLAQDCHPEERGISWDVNYRRAKDEIPPASE